MQQLQHKIENLVTRNGQNQQPRSVSLETLDRLLEALNQGTVRAASPMADGRWHVNAWVKRGIMLAFRLGRLSSVPFAGEQFLDRDTLPIRRFGVEDGVRVVPGGSSVRSGAYIAPGVVMMPPSYVNIGAYVDANCMVDSHALVGSCAQIGRRVHLSAGVQVGGVLEPAGAMPVIVEDDVFVGGGCGLFEGILVRERAVLAPGVTLTGSTHLYDLVHECIVERSGAAPLEVPAGAVVVPGSRPVSSPYGKSEGLQLYAPVIVKYRDEKTDASTALTSNLRGDG